MIRVVLGSASPARLAVLRSAGIEPEVVVSEVDETGVSAPDTATLVCELARLKGEAVLTRVLASSPVSKTVVLACDTMLEMGGRPHGKPGSVAAALARLREMRGGTGTLYTGHFVAVLDEAGMVATQVRTAATTVHFADMSDAEIAWYASTGEPSQVAGSFTIDGLGGPFIAGIVGDPHNVIGLSLPLLRQMLADLHLDWPDLFVSVQPDR
jgi:septum formation protein